MSEVSVRRASSASPASTPAAASATLLVKHLTTDKKYKVSVKRFEDPQSGDGPRSLLSDVTAWTLKKNFATILSRDPSEIEVRWVNGPNQASAKDTSMSSQVPAEIGEVLADQELVPLNGLVLLRDAAPDPPPHPGHTQNSPPTATNVEAVARAAHTQGVPSTPGPSAVVRPAASSIPPLAPAPWATATSTMTLSTPKRQELLDLAKHIFHDKSPLRFGERNSNASSWDGHGSDRHLTPDDGTEQYPNTSRPVPPLPSSSQRFRVSQEGALPGQSRSSGVALPSHSQNRTVATASATPTRRDEELQRSPPSPEEDPSYSVLTRSLQRRSATPEQRRSQSRSSSTAAVGAHAIPERYAGALSADGLVERVAELEREKMELAREVERLRMMQVQTQRHTPEPSSATPAAVAAAREPSREPRDVRHSLHSATEESRNAPPTPSPMLIAELNDLKKRRQVLAEVRALKEQEANARRASLQADIFETKTSLVSRWTAQDAAARAELAERVGKLQVLRASVEELQRCVESSDAAADAANVHVSRITHRLDDNKDRILALLRSNAATGTGGGGVVNTGGNLDHQHQSLADAVKRKDEELAQFIAATAAQKHKHLVTLESKRETTLRLRQAYEEALLRRRELHHRVEDAKGNIRVIVRVRPLMPSDALQPEHATHLEDGSLEVDAERHAVFLSTPTTGVKRYEFYSVYGPTRDSMAQQAEIFEHQIKPLLNSVLDGVNVAVMAYGPTGAGKTFTILGKPDDAPDASLTGLLPRSLEYLLETVPRDSVPQRASPDRVSPGRATNLCRLVACSMTMVEVYMDQVFDILGPIVGSAGVGSGGGGGAAAPAFTTTGGQANLANAAAAASQQNRVDIRQSADCVQLTGATEVPITEWTQAVHYIHEAIKIRKTHKTLKNFQSSRSHLIMTLFVTTRKLSASEGAASADGASGTVVRSKLVFVDLAGSERVSRSLSHGDRLKEAQHINKSLAALGDLVHALSSPPGKRPAYIPYRNSRLTQLLYDAVGGNSKTLLVTCICPHIPAQHNLVEIQSALQFGSRAKAVRNALVPQRHHLPANPTGSGGNGDADPLA